MNKQIKMTEEELTEVRMLQDKFQQKIFQLGQLSLQRLQVTMVLKRISEQEPKLEEEWINLQKEENDLINQLLNKYGEGSLDLKEGIFISEKK